jgi:hypothetical protein
MHSERDDGGDDDAGGERNQMVTFAGAAQLA